jgi:endonuclease YncB( thermonuclease family)
MNEHRRHLLLGALVAVAAAVPSSIVIAGSASTSDGPLPATIEGRVVGVIDGDSLRVLDAARVQHEVRLAGIDAPEHDQPFSQRAKQNLSRLVMNREVRVDVQKRDRYDRIIGNVWVTPADLPCRAEPCPKTLDVGRAQLTVGLAWHYRQYAKDQAPQDRGAYESDEAEARARKVGLWSEPNPVAPWDWRHYVREQQR